MRLVRAGGAAPSAAPLPDAAVLEEARALARRYGHLGVSEVVLRPFGEGRWLAIESLQVTGSFKVRGALFALERRRAAGESAVVAASAGNHGAGVAFAAKHLGLAATVVVPRSAPAAKLARMRAAGAEVVVSEAEGYDEAEREALALAARRGVPFLSPYDDVDVLVGNGASLGFEIVRAIGRAPRRVYCPIGGGGLATGLACALRHDFGPAAGEAVVPVQSEASCAFASSLERGAAVTELPPAATLADGLEGGISEASFARARQLMRCALVCTEDEIAAAMRFAVVELGLVLEGSAAVALAAALEPAAHAEESGPEVILLTGRNVDLDRLVRTLGPSPGAGTC
jgi:threonine dehydratase